MSAVMESVIADMPEAEYHAHPALSSSGARKLLPPSCPATFAWERDNPPDGKQVFDVGSAAHKAVLGVGPTVHVIDAPDWRTKAAREQRDEARARGDIPVLVSEWDEIAAMQRALIEHPVAAQLLDDARAELSIFWRDDRTGVDCRARLDLFGSNILGEPVIGDYKTCRSADPDTLARSVAAYGYHVQHAWYVEGAQAVGLADDPGFLFICQEKTPPYPVTVLALDREAVRIGAERARQARSIFAECQATGRWPGHADGIVTASLPKWAGGES